MTLVSINQLDEIHNTSNTNIKNCNEFKDFEFILNKELSDYSDVIKNFFVGKSNEIKSIYTIIRENNLPYNRIKSIDINLSTHMYSDYFEGMTEFIKKVKDLRDSDNISEDAINHVIENVKYKDAEFINSIFGGERNPEEEMDIDSAMKNIEVLIDIEQDFRGFRSLVKTSDLKSLKYADQIKEGLRVFLTSVSNYNYRCIKEIILCYEKIHDSIQTRTSVHGIKTVQEYQLF